MKTDVCSEVAQEFPQEAQEFLRTFYTARGVSLADTRAKIKALREGFDLVDAIVAADRSVSSDEEELQILEFYVLTKSGII